MHHRDRQIEAALPSLRRYARALTRDRDRADDLVQATVVRALDAWSRLRPPRDARAWLFTILHNLHVNEGKRTQRWSAVIADPDRPPEPATAPAQLDGLALADLSRALLVLPEDQRQTLLLVGLEGFRYADVAAITGVPVGTVMSRLSRARERLRLLMDGDVSPLARRTP